MTALNHLIERHRRSRPRVRALAARAARLGSRRPLVLVPSILGTALREPGGRLVWGGVGALYGGASFTARRDLTAAGLLDGFTLVPGLYQHDVFGGLVRFLEDVGGYARERDLFVHAYDWRRSVSDAAAGLRILMAQAAGASGRPVDLVAVSTGGLVARHAIADGAQVGRVVFLGTPQRGSFSALSYLVGGVRPAPLGRRFSPEELAACATAWDALPHPDEPVFVTAEGAPAALPLYDPRTWRELGLDGGRDVAGQLERALRLHRRLDAMATQVDAVAIGARHLPTLARMIVRDGRARLPACSPRRGDPLVERLFEPGDGSVPARSVEGWPPVARMQAVTPALHRELPADPAVHQLVLGALLDGQEAACASR
jgi:hypothetical protein